MLLWVIANVFKRLLSDATEGECIDADRSGLSAETSSHVHTSCAVEEEGLPAGILDDHDRSIVVLQAAGDLGRTSLHDCNILRLHRLTTGWGRERWALIQWYRGWEKKRWRGEGQIVGTDVEDKRCSICTSLEMEPFKIRHLKRPSFTRYSSYGHNKRRRKKGGGHMVMEMKRSREKTPKNSTSIRGSLWTMCSFD